MLKTVSALILAASFAAAPAALAETRTCPGTSLPEPVIVPAISSVAPAEAKDAAYDCMMWQTFIDLNWPSQRGRRGVPDPGKRFGVSAPVVWESFKTVDQVFLPTGEDPGPWDYSIRERLTDSMNSVTAVANGLTRLLRQRAKVSEILSAPVNPNSPLYLGKKKTLLDDENQTDGSNLIDQNGQPVFYEMLMNHDEYAYIIGNKLYNATLQGAYARENGIELPAGASAFGPTGAIEVKAAWKVLGPGDDPKRFHTAHALVGSAQEPVLVGLVGLHIVQHVGPLHQPLWATFAQIDNVPLAGEHERRHYSFFNSDCPAAHCPTNTATEEPTPTQAVQEWPIGARTALVNARMQQRIAEADPDAPWQYYQLIGVQWPKKPEALPAPPQKAPLPMGGPNTQTLLNPVLETFLQPYTAKQPIGCLSCHVMARIAESRDPPFAAGYSFLLSHARGLQ